MPRPELPAVLRQNLMVGAFFGVLLALGVGLHRDYGVSWDEPVEHLNGMVAAKYIAQHLPPSLAPSLAGYEWVPALRSFQDSDHGSLFELVMVALGRWLTPGNSQSYYHLRHLLTFGTFVLGLWTLYRIASLRHHNWSWGLLAAGLLAASPRMFAEAFYNFKDVGFTALFTLGIYTLLRLRRRPTVASAVLHGAATALAIDIRTAGLLLMAFTVVLLTADAAAAGQRAAWRRWAALGVVYALATAAVAVAGWPYLWEAPAENLLRALQRMSAFPWPHRVLYFGRLTSAQQLPWHYVPVWISLTTPLPVLVAGVAGLLAVLRTTARAGRGAWRQTALRFDWLLVAWLLVPLALVIGLKSVVYDGWRHLYFVYPALVLLAVRGLRALWGQVRQRCAGWRWAAAALALAALETGHTLVRMEREHPFQFVYFSFLRAPAAERLFERDYWGLSYYQGLEWLLAHDPAPQLAINVPWHHPLYNNSLILPLAQRARVRFVPLPQARYFLSAYRWHPQPYAPDSVGQEIHCVRAGELKILSVFRRF